MRDNLFFHGMFWFIVLLFLVPMTSCGSPYIPEVPVPVIDSVSLPSYSSEPASPVLSIPKLHSRSIELPLAIIAEHLWMDRRIRINKKRLLPHSRSIQRVTIHHTATPQGKNARLSLRGIQRYHMMEKGWTDIAYHYLIASDGKIYEGRNAAYIGSSSTDYQLDNNLMIALIGNFEKYSPSQQALQSLKNLVVNKLVKYNLRPGAVYTHGEQADTLCPGGYLKDWYTKKGKAAISRQFYASLPAS